MIREMRVKYILYTSRRAWAPFKNEHADAPTRTAARQLTTRLSVSPLTSHAVADRDTRDHARKRDTCARLGLSFRLQLYHHICYLIIKMPLDGRYNHRSQPAASRRTPPASQRAECPERRPRSVQPPHNHTTRAFLLPPAPECPGLIRKCLGHPPVTPRASGWGRHQARGGITRDG